MKLPTAGSGEFTLEIKNLLIITLYLYFYNILLIDSMNKSQKHGNYLTG
jgi:hypothetical protein